MSELHEQLQALSEIPFWEWPPSAYETVREALRSGEADDRLLGVEMIGQMMDNELAETALQLVQSDPDERVAAQAAIALGPALEECSIEYDDEDDLDDEEAEAFEGIEPPLSSERYEQICQTLQAVYDQQSLPDAVRRAALEAAVRAPMPWQTDAVRAAYQTGDRAWQATAVFCMGFLDGFRVQILEALGSKDAEIKREALLAAAGHGLQEAGAEAMHVARASENDAELRLAAIEALAHLDPPGVQELLEDLTSDGNEEIAQAAADAIEDRLLFSADD